MMNELERFHHDFAYLAIAINILASIWMFLSLKIVDLKRKKYFFAPVYIGWLAICVQAFLGISLFMSGEKLGTGKGFHYFYGFIAMMTAAILFSYSKTMGKKKILIYAVSSLFLGGLGIRAAWIAFS
ncbi:MAG: hypothetical protein U0R17_02775 [Acidimicrobiia bacterium]